MITCPTCNSSIGIEQVEEMIIRFMLAMREETWISYDVLIIKFLIFDQHAGQKMNTILKDMIDKNLIECESTEVPYHIRKYKLKYRGH